MATHRASQQAFTYRTWGGRRAGAGRPAERPNRAPHRARPAHVKRHPVHVTLRVVWQLGSMRRQRPFAVLWAALQEACAAADRLGLRIVHYSVQHDHIHMLVEAQDKRSLGQGIKGFSVRAARALNALFGRRGRVFSDRYHAATLESPRQVRNAISYVIHNARKHRRSAGERFAHRFDPFSSAVYFPGWSESRASWVKPPTGPPPVAPPETWLLVAGWRRGGALSVGEEPGARRSG